MHNFKELKVWQAALGLAVDVYDMTDRLPDSERFGLTSQMRRAAVSIASNIAEGAGRRSDKDVKRFLSVARGSAAELETQAILCHRLGFWPEESADNISQKIDEVRAMLVGLSRNLLSQPS